MEWTGARYRDTPSTQVETFVAAPPEAVWALVSDLGQMPATSPELREIEWLDGATGPGVGARFVGRSEHPAIGRWESVSTVVECDPPHALAWAVSDPGEPAATWRLSIRPAEGGAVLTEWVRLGPGPSGLSPAIARMPDREEKIVFSRMREFETNMTATLSAYKQRLESA